MRARQGALDGFQRRQGGTQLPGRGILAELKLREDIARSLDPSRAFSGFARSACEDAPAERLPRFLAGVGQLGEMSVGSPEGREIAGPPVDSGRHSQRL